MGCNGNETETRRYYLALASELPDRAHVLWVGAAPPDDFVSASRTADIDLRCVPRVEASSVGPGPTSLDRVVLNLVANGRLDEGLDAARERLTPAGRLVVGVVDAASARHAAAALRAPAGEARAGTTLPAVIATLAAHGFVVEHVRAIRDGDVDPAPASVDLPRALRADPRVDYHVVVARPASIEAATRAAEMLAATLGRADDPASVDAPAYDALLRQERQLASFDRSLGWRLLARYGPYKHRFVLPAWEAIKDRARALRTTRGERPTDYDRWVRFAAPFHDGVLEPIAAGSADAERLVTVIVPVVPGTADDLAITVASVLAQSHRAWELRVAPVDRGLDAAATSSSIGPLASDPRVVLLDDPATTGAAATNLALADARGEIVLLLPAPVELAPDALAAFVRAAAATDGDVFYGDEDVRDAEGRRRDPDLKPAWSPDALLARMYWPHVVAYRASFLREVAPLREDVEAAAHYDLALRATERRARVVHIPRILSHAHGTASPAGAPTSSGAMDAPHGPHALDAVDAGKRVLEAALARRGVTADVEPSAGDVYRVRRAIPNPGSVTIIVPTRDNLGMVQRCLLSLATTDHPSFEIVVVDNGSVDPATLAFLASTRHRVIRAPGPFNFSRLNNRAVADTASEYVVFLNDDTEVTDPGWLRALEEHAQRPEVGAVGARLLYPNGRIQHAGIALGIGGLAGHPWRFRSQAPAGARNVSAVTAACLMMRRATFERVGAFDERLPVNSNDVDLCLRLRDRGYLIVYTPHATLIHHESASRGLRATPDDAWLMLRRWRPVLRADPYYNPNAELATESGDMDLSKPDGLVRVYDGAPGVVAALHVPAGARVGQSCYVATDDLAAIVIRSLRGDDGTASAIRLTLREFPEGEPIRVVDRSLPGRTPDERWFCFEPVAAAGGRRWHFTLESAEAEAFVVSRTAVVSDVTGPCFENGEPTYGTIVFELYTRAAYRCLTSGV